MSLHFVIKCVLNNRIRGKLCVQYKMNPFWTFIIVYYCNLWYPVISVRKWNVCYFFLIFCYQMKCPGTRRINLPLFFSYIFYYCHTNRIRYEQIIWTTLYYVNFTYLNSRKFLRELRWKLQFIEKISYVYNVGRVKKSNFCNICIVDLCLNRFIKQGSWRRT